MFDVKHHRSTVCRSRAIKKQRVIGIPEVVLVNNSIVFEPRREGVARNINFHPAVVSNALSIPCRAAVHAHVGDIVKAHAYPIAKYLVVEKRPPG